jgi:DNA-directed RNA polymerase beta' subunit
MKIDIFNIDEFVKVNRSPRVSNPVYFNFDKTPTVDGLFSYELFGSTDLERKNIFGYVELFDNYIHPIIFSMMTSRMGSFRQILTGEKYAVIVDKKIKIVDEDFPGAESGLDFFYDHFEEIKWIDEFEEAETESIDRKKRLKFLESLTKDEFFVRKWLIIPPFYRAVNTEDRTMGDNINKLYTELISRTNSMDIGAGFGMFGAQSKYRIQQLLLEIYLETIRPIKGKNSLVRKHLLGKTIDYTSSNVITSPEISKAERPEDLPVKFGYGAFPLATIISLFHPFFVNVLTDTLTDFVGLISDVYSKEITRIDKGQYSTDVVEKLVKMFIKSETERFNPILIHYVNTAGEKIQREFIITEYRSKADLDSDNGIDRPLTLTDIFYLAAIEITEDKHVYVTRYPVTNFQNIYPSKINILTTSKTRDVYIRIGDNIEFMKQYPCIKFDGDPKPSPKTHYGFYNVLIPGNIYLKALGGDYDGDMLYLKGLFTKEANAEAERLIYSKSNILNASGGGSRGITKIGKEAVLALFELTKES